MINVEGSENNTRLQIAFQAQGIKWLIAHLAKLEKCGRIQEYYIFYRLISLKSAVNFYRTFIIYE